MIDVNDILGALIAGIAGLAYFIGRVWAERPRRMTMPPAPRMRGRDLSPPLPDPDPGAYRRRPAPEPSRAEAYRCARPAPWWRLLRATLCWTVDGQRRWRGASSLATWRGHGAYRAKVGSIHGIGYLAERVQRRLARGLPTAAEAAHALRDASRRACWRSR